MDLDRGQDDFSPHSVLTCFQAQSLNPDFSIESLGLNLNELWGEAWDLLS